MTLGWPIVTCSDLQWPYGDLYWPYTPPLTSTYLTWSILGWIMEIKRSTVEGRWVVVVVATKFSVKHQGKDNHHPPSTIYKWPLSDLPRSTLSPSLSLSFTILRENMNNLPAAENSKLNYHESFKIFRMPIVWQKQSFFWDNFCSTEKEGNTDIYHFPNWSQEVLSNTLRHQSSIFSNDFFIFVCFPTDFV